MTDEELDETFSREYFRIIEEMGGGDQRPEAHFAGLRAVFEAGRSGDTIPVPRELLNELQQALYEWDAMTGDPEVGMIVVAKARALLARTKETTTDGN